MARERAEWRTVYFRFRSETKGTYRYEEIYDDNHQPVALAHALIGTIYIRKDQWDGSTPTYIEVTIKPRDRMK